MACGVPASLWRVDFRRWRVLVAAASGLAVSALAQSAAEPEMRLAADAHNRGDFAGAVQHFEKAVAADPANLRARLFMANAYTREYVAEGKFDSDERERSLLLMNAQKQYREVLARDPKNAGAMFGIVAMNGPGENANSREMMLKLIRTDPGRADAYSTLGAIDWQIAYDALRKANPARIAQTRIADAAVRARVREQALPYIEEGLRVLQVTLQKEPEDRGAMAYMNLLARAKAAVVDSPEESRSLLALGDEWARKARLQRRVAAVEKDETKLDVDADPPVSYAMPPPPPPPPPPPASSLPPPPPPPRRKK